MVSIINNSNQVSALIQSIESSDSRENPYIYSTMPVSCSYATQYQKLIPTSGSSRQGSNMTFSLPKFGYLQQILLSFDVNIQSSSSDQTLFQGMAFDLIDKIQLLAGARVVSELTAMDLLSQFSDLTNTELKPIQLSWINGRPVGTVGSKNKYVVPVWFGFMSSLNTQLNSSFLEPLNIKIFWNAYSETVGSNSLLTTNDAITDVELSVRYANLPDEAQSEALSLNYDKPELNILSTRFFDEAPVVSTFATAPTGEQKMTMELKNTDVVQNFYVVLRLMSSAGTTGTGGVSPITSPCQISPNKVEFFASGQKLYELTKEEYVHTRLCPNGWARSPMDLQGLLPAGSAGSTSARNVGSIAPVKIQTGYIMNNEWTNGISLREINNPRIVVHYDPLPNAGANQIYRVDVCEDCSAIFSQSSASGRLQLALSN